MCGSIMLVCASILHISYPWLTDSLSTNSLENITGSIIAQITWRRKSRCFIFQSRMCFEKIPQIIPGKENLIKGRSLFCCCDIPDLFVMIHCFFKDQPISLILTCHLLIHPHIISFFIDQNVSDPPSLLSTVPEHLNQVDLEERQDQELSAVQELSRGAAEVTRIPLLLDKLSAPGQQPFYYCGGFAILAEAVTNSESPSVSVGLL